jgi:hypothetical protein
MTITKISISLGQVTFSGEGNEAWLEKQLDKLLKAASSHPVQDHAGPTKHSATGIHTENIPGTLASFLQKKSAASNQVKRFLATAQWLHLKGSKRIQTKDVAKALSDSNQKRLGNPSDCLNQNVSKGHCEKEGSQFYVSPEGVTYLG